MRQDWEPEDLIEVWTLLEDDTKRVRNKSGTYGWFAAELSPGGGGTFGGVAGLHGGG
ncbi:hypothetical protein [Streptomyces sp. NPDC059970]|uniref:hypothetical protein n=1 Tax=Streptomyces sp. NPDC059970 TaxID=3347019 RepID=UPI003674B56A